MHMVNAGFAEVIHGSSILKFIPVILKIPGAAASNPRY